MINTVFNLPRLKCFLKTGSSTFFLPLSKNYKKSFLECQKKSLGLISTRPFFSSVKTFEKSTQNNSNVVSKNENSLIYMGAHTNKLKALKLTASFISVVGIASQAVILQNIFHGHRVTLNLALLTCVGFFTYVSPFLIHIFSRNYVTEIWYNSSTDTYTATLMSFFLKKININFKAEDIHIPLSEELLATMYIKGKPVLIISDFFLEMEDYFKMMRYDKSIDLNIKHTSDEHSSKEI